MRSMTWMEFLLSFAASGSAMGFSCNLLFPW